MAYGTIAISRRPACQVFDGCGGPRDAYRTYADSRALERMRKCCNRRRIALAHPLHQEFRLTVEQLQDFSLKTAIAKCHAREVIAVEDRSLQHIGWYLISNSDRGLRYLGLPLVFLLSWSLA